jgi:hypothetical protein
MSGGFDKFKRERAKYDRVAEAYLADMPFRDIQQQFNLSRAGVRFALEKAGVKRTRKGHNGRQPAVPKPEVFDKLPKG